MNKRRYFQIRNKQIIILKNSRQYFIVFSPFLTREQFRQFIAVTNCSFIKVKRDYVRWLEYEPMEEADIDNTDIYVYMIIRDDIRVRILAQTHAYYIKHKKINQLESFISRKERK